MAMMETKTVHLTVSLEYNDKYAIDDILENMDYDFNYEDAIQYTEILECEEIQDYDRFYKTSTE